MISLSQATALANSVEYRDWEISVLSPSALTSVSDMLVLMSITAQGKVPVWLRYTAPDSDPDREGLTVTNDVYVAVPLTETEAEFARAIYEAITTIEDHERREFFKIGTGRIDDRPTEKRSRAIFHPHGVNRNKMFHDLDSFAARVRVENVSDGQRFSADAVS